MKAVMTELYRGCMRGRTMYVIPFCMGPLEAENPMFGVEITDAAYVVASMRIMTRMGSHVLEAMGDDAPFVPALHSVGAPLEPGQAGRAVAVQRHQVHLALPGGAEIWSYGSGYGGNSLLGKKCYSLRIACVMARDEGWLAEHMLILKLTCPSRRSTTSRRRSRRACGKTNLAMLEPTIPGWKVETLGDDIAWMRFGEDGRLYAVNPEYGLFGVAPGTGWNTNPNAMRTLAKGNSVFTNVALHRRRRHLVGGHADEPPAHLTDWKGHDWTPESDEPSSHPNSPLLHADHAVPDPGAGVRRPERRADLGDPLRRPPQDHDPAGHRGPRLGARRLHGRDALLRDHRRRDRRRSASSAATRWPCCRSSATTPATTSGTGSRSARAHDADASCRRSST